MAHQIKPGDSRHLKQIKHKIFSCKPNSRKYPTFNLHALKVDSRTCPQIHFSCISYGVDEQNGITKSVKINENQKSNLQSPREQV